MYPTKTIVYPSKEEILKTPFKISQKIIKITTDWKKVYLKGLKQKTTKDKLKEITTLLYLLTGSREPVVKLGTSYGYDLVGMVLFLNKNRASLVSALHELGHHFYGASELKACRFSIWLFKAVFPEFYEKLSWKKHLLVKK